MSTWLELQGKGKSTRELRVIYWHKEGAQGRGARNGGKENAAHPG